MKRFTDIRYFLLLLLFLSGCQQEVLQIEKPDPSKTLTSDSELLDLFQEIATQDGSFDDLLDQSSCIILQLPLRVSFQGKTLEIKTAQDILELENTIREKQLNVQTIRLMYPVRAVMADYSEQILNNKGELQRLSLACEDQDIECVDFDYPLTVATYNTTNQVSENREINNDREFYYFLETIDEQKVVSIEFPVKLKLANGSEQIVTTNEELLHAIMSNKDSCDEEDNKSFDPSNTDHELEEILVAYGWQIDRYVHQADSSEYFKDYSFWFNAEGTITVGTSNEEQLGEWEIEQEDSDTELELEFEEEVKMLSEKWKVLTYDTQQVKLQSEDSSKLLIFKAIEEEQGDEDEDSEKED